MSSPTPSDEYARAGLLDGLTGADRHVRGAVLDALAKNGVDQASMREAIDNGRMGLLLLESTLTPGIRLSLQDVCERTGLDQPTVRRWFQALGRPLAPDPAETLYTAEDVTIARQIHSYRALGTADADMLPVVRAVGRGVSSMADALGTWIGEGLLAAGEPDPELALRYVAQARSVLDGDPLAFTHLVSAALAERLRSHTAALDGRSTEHLRSARDITVCFADLVGFTSLGETVSAVELSEVADELAACASEVAVAPTRLTKTIGDAVMLVSTDPTALVSSAVALAAAWQDSGAWRPRLRIGIARGAGVARAGDWIGPPVNLASRVTTSARPGRVVVTKSVRDAVAAAHGENDSFSWRATAPRKFKGVRDVVRLYRVTRT